jgi:guanosine-3',5'-bis(diphosphate) 3'-pyrophosphohydrolase
MGTVGVSTISEILDTIRGYSPDADLEVVMKAYLLAAKAHAGQTRKSGEPYLTHPLAVAGILADMKMDVDTIATALLHDALEDNPLSVNEMRSEMGEVITRLVDGVTKIGKLKFRSNEELQAENFRKMMLAMSADLRVILVKLADRLHNMETLGFHGKPEKQKGIARETLDIFVPIANRLGLTRMKGALEDLCFLYLEPEACAEINAHLEETHGGRADYTARVAEALNQQLHAQGVECEVFGRAKHRYSIFKKMRESGLKVAEVQDILGFRVLVDDIGECYHALGLIHASFPPVPDRIKDYIARPKANGYQSLHTTVVGPEGLRVEVQIRTRAMHRIAEEGIAAHWKYKEGRLALTTDDVARISKIRDLFESAREADNATDFMETVKGEFYADEVFVFTPNGDVKQMPQGSTTLDFAYSVHTDVGNRCTGARVNGRIVPLRYSLKSGDTVEILTSPSQKPNRDWLEIARTGRAIQKIRRELRLQERELGIRLGQEMLEAELKKYHASLQKVKAEGKLLEIAEARGYKDLDHLFVEVAHGQVTPLTLVREILPEEARAPQASPLSSLFTRWRGRTESPVLISGEDGVLVTFARCCGPLPGESVAGYITRGRGISVHKIDCPQLKTQDGDRRIAVEWDPRSTLRHSGEIQILCTDRPGMLSNITKACEQAQVNINRAEARNMPDGRALCTLELAVRDVGELSRLIKTIERITGVEGVNRMAG